MRIVVSALVMLALCACSPASPPSEATTAEPAASTGPTSSVTEFQFANGVFGCIYTPAGGTEVYETADGAAELKCDRVEPDYVRVTLPEHGAATVLTRVGDAGCCGGETLAAGTHWSAGPFQCEINETELTCVSAEDHGFTLSRESANTR